MPKNSATIILSGHGVCLPKKIVDMNASQQDFCTIFTCPLGATLAASQHNQTIATLGLCGKDRILETLFAIEAPITAQTFSKQPQGALVADMDAKNLHLCYDHALSNAPDMPAAQTLFHTNGVGSNLPNRFISKELEFIYNHGNQRNWAGANLVVEFDREQIAADVAASQQKNMHFSANSLFCIKVTAAQGQRASMNLSEFIGDVIPKLKIFASKHSNGTVEVYPSVFLDDRGAPALNDSDCRANYPIFQNQGDEFYEISFAGDTNIVWNSCREFLQ